MTTIQIPATSFDYIDMLVAYSAQDCLGLLDLHCKLRNQAYAEVCNFPADRIERAFATTRVVFDLAVEDGLGEVAEQLCASYPQIKAEVQALVNAGEML